MLSVRMRSLASSRARQEMNSHCIIVADPGEGPGGRPPLFLDRIEARRAKKHFFWRPGSPLFKDLDDLAPLTSRSGSGNALYMYLYSCDHTNTLHCNACQSTGQCGRQNWTDGYTNHYPTHSEQPSSYRLRSLVAISSKNNAFKIFNEKI